MYEENSICVNLVAGTTLVCFISLYTDALALYNKLTHSCYRTVTHIVMPSSTFLVKYNMLSNNSFGGEKYSHYRLMVTTSV